MAEFHVSKSTVYINIQECLCYVDDSTSSYQRYPKKMMMLEFIDKIALMYKKVRASPITILKIFNMHKKCYSMHVQLKNQRSKEEISQGY